MEPSLVENLADNFSIDIPEDQKLKPYLHDTYKALLYLRNPNKQLIDQMSENVLRKLYWEDYITELKTKNDPSRVIKMHPDVSKDDFDYVQRKLRGQQNNMVLIGCGGLLGMFYEFRRRKLQRREMKHSLAIFAAAPIVLLAGSYFLTEGLLNNNLRKSGMIEKYRINSLRQELGSN